MTTPTTAQPGWYPDTAIPGTLRWFDGAAWTEHTAPTPAQAVPPQPWPTAPAPVPWQQPVQAWPQQSPTAWSPNPADTNGPASVAHWMVPVGRSWQSILAGYLGIFSLGIWPLGPFAIAAGIWALVKARQGGHGRGRAITGIVGGAFGIAMLLLLTLG